MFLTLFLSVAGLFSSKDKNPSIIIEDYPFKLCYVVTTGILFFCSSLLGIQDAFGKWEAVYDRYSFSIGIGRYIGFTDKGNVLSVSLLVSADTDFLMGC